MEPARQTVFDAFWAGDASDKSNFKYMLTKNTHKFDIQTWQVKAQVFRLWVIKTPKMFPSYQGYGYHPSKYFTDLESH